MKLKTCLVLALAAAASLQSTFGSSIPKEISSILEASTFYIDFNQPDFTPTLGESGRPVNRTAEIVSLDGGGHALKSEKKKLVTYLAKHNIDFTAPGSVSFWVSPRGWNWGNDRPYNHFFSAAGQKGRVAVTRMGLVHPNGQSIKRQDRILLNLSGFDEFPANLTASVGESDSVTWADGTWHLFVITWDGPLWTLTVDSDKQKILNTPRGLNPEEITVFSIGGCEEPTLIKHFTIYNKVLDGNEIQQLFEHQRPKD